MNRRTAKKVLGDPWRYSRRQIVRASALLRPWWTEPHPDDGSLLDAHGIVYTARSMGGMPRSSAYRRAVRVQGRKLRGRHDFHTVPF